MPVHRAYIGLGSNLGNRERFLSRAIERLQATQGVISLRPSSVYETEPIGGPSAQNPYLNAAARLETKLSAEALMSRMLQIEQALGRTREERWGPRTIDLDLLLFDDAVLRLPHLIVPHPRMHERWFVLAPLAEVGGEAIHPVLGKSVRSLLDDLRNAPGSRLGE